MRREIRGTSHKHAVAGGGDYLSQEHYHSDVIRN